MPDLKINVTQQGAQQTAAQLTQVAAATEKTTQAASKSVGATKGAADATKGLGDALSGLGSRNNDAKDVLEGVSAAAKGGSGALFGIAKAARAAFAVFASGPIGIAVAGVALLGTALLALADKFSPAKKSAEELAAETEKAAQAAQRLNDLKLESLKAEIEAVDQASKNATVSFDLLQKKAEAIDNAQEGLEIADLGAKNLGEEERAKAEADIRQKFGDRRRAREVGADEFSVEQVRKRSDAAQQTEVQTLKDLELEQGRVASLEKQLETARGRARVESEGGGAFSPTAILANRRFEKTKEQLDPQIDAAKKEEAEAEKRFAAANARAIKLTEERLAAEKKFEVSQDTRKEVQPIEQKRQQIEASKATTEARAKDAARQKQIDELAQKSREQQAAGDFAGQDETVAQISKLTKPGGAPQAFTPQKFSTSAPPAKSRDLQKAAEDIKNTPPLNAAPIAEPVKEISTAVQKQTAQSQENINAAGQQIAGLAANVGPPPDLTPLVQQVVNLDSVRGEQIAALRQQIQDQARQISQLVMSVRNSMPTV